MSWIGFGFDIPLLAVQTDGHVAGGSGGDSGILLEDGTNFLLMEDGISLLVQES